MRRFNPEKELRKIENSNRNKIIVGICSLLLIIAIGSTYALYQVKHTNKLVFNTVGEFKKKDILISVKLDDKEESVDSFPKKEDAYVYSHMECEKNNITNITWDEEHWKLNVDINGQDKCTVYFVKSPFHMKSCENKSMADCLLEEGRKFTNILAFDDPDQNGRYYGSDPANYIWFNCDDYNVPSEDTCERWRIIGSFNNIDKVVDNDNTIHQNLVKIVRSSSIGHYAFDNRENPEIKIGSGGEVGINKWQEARLMKLLNPGYEDESVGGSLYYNGSGSNVTECYNYGVDMTVKCDFRKIGLKNDNTRNMIETIIWDVSAFRGDDSADLVYQNERANFKINDTYETKWKGKVALMYLSDYYYATIGGVNYNRNACLNSPSHLWSKDYKECSDNNWLNLNIGEYLLLPWVSPFASTRDLMALWFGHSSGRSGSYTNGGDNVRPTLYLTHDTKISGGDGTYENPYTIAVQ